MSVTSDFNLGVISITQSYNISASQSDPDATPYFNEIGSNGGHEWLIEFDREPASRANFEEEIDNALKKFLECIAYPVLPI